MRKTKLSIFTCIVSIFLFFIIVEGALQITSLFIGDEQNSDKRNEEYAIACFGDSFTYGLGAETEAGSFPSQLQLLCNGKKVCNKGVPGNNSALVYQRLNEFFSEHSVDTAVVLVGINNYWNTRGITQHRTPNFFEQLKIFTLFQLLHDRFFPKAQPLLNIPSKTRTENINLSEPVHMYKEYFENYRLPDIEQYMFKETKNKLKNMTLSESEAAINEFSQQFSNSIYTQLLKSIVCEIHNDQTQLSEILKKALHDLNNVETVPMYMVKIYVCSKLAEYYMQQQEFEKAVDIVKAHFSSSSLIYTFLITNMLVTAKKYKQAAHYLYTSRFTEFIPDKQMYDKLFYSSFYRQYCLSLLSVMFYDTDSILLYAAEDLYKKNEVSACFSILFCFYYQFPQYDLLWSIIADITDNTVDTSHDHSFLGISFSDIVYNDIQHYSIEKKLTDSMNKYKNWAHKDQFFAVKNEKEDLLKDSVMFNYSVAQMYAHIGNIKQALVYYERVIDIAPDNTHVLNILGELYSQQTENKETYAKKAIECFKNAFEQTYNIQLYMSKLQYCITDTAQRDIYLEKAEQYLEKHNRDRELEHVKKIRAFCNSQQQISEILLYDLKKIYDLCRKNNVQLILQTYPFFIEINNTIRSFAQQHNITLVDHEQIFSQYADQTYFVADLHCNDKGYRLMAESIYKSLTKK